MRKKSNFYSTLLKSIERTRQRALHCREEKRIQLLKKIFLSKVSRPESGSVFLTFFFFFWQNVEPFLFLVLVKRFLFTLQYQKTADQRRGECPPTPSSRMLALRLCVSAHTHSQLEKHCYCCRRCCCCCYCCVCVRVCGAFSKSRVPTSTSLCSQVKRSPS